MQFIATCGCQGAVFYPNKKKAAAKNKNPAKWRNPYIFHDHGAYGICWCSFPQKTPRKRASSCCNSPFTLKRPSPEADRAAEGESCYMSSVAACKYYTCSTPWKMKGGDLKNTQFLDGSWWWKCLNTKYKKCSLIFLNKPLSWKHETFSSWEGTICRHYLTGGPSWQEMGAAFGEELFRILEGDTLGGHRNKQQGNNVDADPQQQLGTWCQAGLGSPWSTIQPIQFCQAMPSPPSFSSDWQHMSDDCTFRTWIRASTFKNNSTKHHRHPLGVVLRSFFYFCTMVNHHGNKTGFEIIFCPKHVKSSLCKARLRWTPQFGLKF